jgi:hypothetical protein
MEGGERHNMHRITRLAIEGDNVIGQPSLLPSTQPSARPSTQPSMLPTVQPSSQPSMQPSVKLSSLPSIQPSLQLSCYLQFSLLDCPLLYNQVGFLLCSHLNFHLSNPLHSPFHNRQCSHQCSRQEIQFSRIIPTSSATKIAHIFLPHRTRIQVNTSSTMSDIPPSPRSTTWLSI